MPTFPKPKSVTQHAKLLAARHRRRADRLCQPFSADEWLLILWRARGRCYLCGAFMPVGDRSVEHLHSMVDGGSDSFRNIAPAHKHCAAAKSRKDVFEVLSPDAVRDLHQRLHGPESTDERLLRTMVIAAAEELGLDPFDETVSTMLLAIFTRLSDSRGKAILSHDPDPEPPTPPAPSPASAEPDPVAQHVLSAAAIAHSHAGHWTTRALPLRPSADTHAA